MSDQIYNPKTKKFVKRDQNGAFVASKDTPYKNLDLTVAHTTYKKTTPPKNTKGTSK